MRFTELERSLLSLAAALVARLDLIEQGDDFADSIANDAATVADLRRESNRRETELIDEREDIKRDRDTLISWVTALLQSVHTQNPNDLPKHNGYAVYCRCMEEGDAEAPKPAEPKQLQLEVGKKYRRRDGQVVTVHSYDDDVYPFHGGGCSYTPGGVWHVGRQNPLDLIEEVTEEAAGVAA